MSAPSALDGVKVLVAEDQAPIALDLEATLRDLGCVVLGPTPTVAATLASLADERPDLALLDLGLLDGWSEPVARALREAGVPFALTTGHLPDGLDAPALRGAPCLEEPFGERDLRSVLLGLLGRPPAPTGAGS